MTPDEEDPSKVYEKKLLSDGHYYKQYLPGKSNKCTSTSISWRPVNVWHLNHTK